MNPVLLRGITWNHSRALPPLVATAQRFEEQHPGMRIQWEKRSLHEFGHADIFLNFLGLCVSRGSAVAACPEQLVDSEIGIHCLEQLCELADLMTDEVYGMNPIALYERMTNEDSIAYCPFAYTYSNYSREG